MNGVKSGQGHGIFYHKTIHSQKYIFLYIYPMAKNSHIYRFNFWRNPLSGDGSQVQVTDCCTTEVAEQKGNLYSVNKPDTESDHGKFRQKKKKKKKSPSIFIFISLHNNYFVDIFLGFKLSITSLEECVLPKTNLQLILHLFIFCFTFLLFVNEISLI